jgi:hypothetical protein
MMSKLRIFLNAIYIVIFLNVVSNGQTIGYFSIDAALDSNPFRYLEEESSWISQLGFGIQPKLGSMYFSYNGNYTTFDRLPERNYYWHQAALFSKQDNMEFGTLYEQTINGNEYEIFNSSNFAAYLNNYFSWGEFNFFSNLEGTLNYYSQLEELDNFNFDVGIKTHRSFETGTTFIFGTIFHYKKYLNNIYVQDSTAQSSGGTSGQGGMGQGGQMVNNIYSEYDAPSVSQIQYWARLAQSITTTTGLALQFQSRMIVGGTSRYLSFIAFNYADESQIFDDPLGYENQNYGLELTQLLPLGIVLKGAYYKNEKDYATQGVYTDAENYNFQQLRKDTRTNAWITIHKRFVGGFLGSENLTLKLTYQWLDNNSNSYWYNYQSQYMGLNFSLNF